MIIDALRNMDMANLVDCAIIVFLISIVLAMIFKERKKLIAIMIPLWTTISVVLYQLYIRVEISKSRDIGLSLISDLKESNSTNEEFIKKAVDYLQKLMEDDFHSSLSFIVSIFGIVLSVWVGLTIYNAVKKDELENLIKNVEDSNKLNIKVHVSNLYRIFDTNWTSSEFYLKEFPKIKWSLSDCDIISSILLIENCFKRAVKYDDNSQYIELLSLMPHAFELLSESQKVLGNNKVYTLVRGYYYQRKADFFYFQGMGERYTGKDCSDSFKKSLNNYKKAVGLCRRINYHGYIDNTIGFLLYLLSNHGKEKDYLDQAKEFLINACKEENYLYYKNLGCIYELDGQYDEAENCYRRSIKLNPHDFKSRICLASLLIKKLKNEMGIERNRTTLLCKQTFSFKDDYARLIEEIKTTLNIAEKIAPSMIDTYYKRGELLTYCNLCEKNRSPELIQEIKDAFSMSCEFNETLKAHLFHERNFYESIGEIERANEINSKLLPEGDSEHMSKLYLKELGVE